MAIKLSVPSILRWSTGQPLHLGSGAPSDDHTDPLPAPCALEKQYKGLRGIFAHVKSTHPFYLEHTLGTKTLRPVQIGFLHVSGFVFLRISCSH